MCVGVIENERYNEWIIFGHIHTCKKGLYTFKHLYGLFTRSTNVRFALYIWPSFGCLDRWTFFWNCLLGLHMPKKGVIFECLNRIHTNLYFSLLKCKSGSVFGRISFQTSELDFICNFIHLVLQFIRLSVSMTVLNKEWLFWTVLIH